MENVSFTTSLEGIEESKLQGFFVGWLNAPTPEKHLQLLKNSNYFVLAIDTESKKVVGFIAAITDEILAAYIPFLEVLPSYQKKGIGKELVARMLEMLKGYYMIDLLCDPELQPFYENIGLKKATGMMRRNYEKQGGIQ
ncbi:MAG: GNAT family N-acetyltransferase [Patescibacteria group bacterium]